MRSLRWMFLLALFAGSSVWAEDRGVVIVTDESGQTMELYSGSYALLIGVSDYTAGWPDLESVPRELDEVRRALRAQGFQVVKVIDPDSEQLERAFKNFIDVYGYDRNNRLLFFFSGHGHTWEEAGHGYLVPRDAPRPATEENDPGPAFLRKVLYMSDILAWSRQMTANHALFLFDSCFSGSVFKEKALPSQPPHISHAVARPVREFITAGSAGETVPARSVFTPAFVDALEYAEGDLNNDGYITGMELGLHLEATVPKYARQSPQFGKHPTYRLARGDFVFKVDKTPAPTRTQSALLMVRSNVVGDTVYVNDQVYGPTGRDLIELTPGEYKVRVEKDGYIPWEMSVALGTGERRTLQAQLMAGTAKPVATVQAGEDRDTPMMGVGLTGMDFGDYHALVIGNNDYKFLTALRTARSDAEAVAGILRNKYGFEVTTLYDADRYQILDTLNKLRKTLTEEDNLLIYYAGHGDLDEINDRGYWLPIDAEPDSKENWISNVALADVFNAMSAKHVLVVADSCFSGTLTRSAVTQVAANQTGEALATNYRTMVKQRSRTALTSGGLAPVLDAGGSARSVFAEAFIDSLRANEDILDGQKMFLDIVERVNQAADERRFEQIPQYAPIKHTGHEAGDFFFVPK